MKDSLTPMRTMLLCASALVCASSFAQPVLAQTTAPTAQSGGVTLQDVIVTARRTSENIITTPEAITAVSARQIETLGITNLLGLSAFTPGFRPVNQAYGRNDRGYNTYAMRGIYGGDGIPRQPVRIFMDGVPVGGGDVAGFDGIQNVEVIEGPQSAHFGRSTFGGAVNFITARPSNQFHDSASADYGSYNTYELKASVEGPILADDKLNMRVSARDYSHGAEYGDYGTPYKMGSRSTESITGSLYSAPIDHLRVRAFVEAWVDDDGPSAQGFYTPSLYNCNAGAAAAGTLNYTCGQISSVNPKTIYGADGFSPQVLTALSNNSTYSPLRTNFLNHVGLHREAVQGSASFEYDLPKGYMVSGNYGLTEDKWALITDVYNQPVAATRLVFVGVDVKDKSAELRFATPNYFDRVKVMVGVNYLDQQIPGAAPAYFGNVNAISYATDPTLNASRTYGVFGSIHWQVMDKLALDLEGRQQDDRVIQKTIPNYPISSASVRYVDLEKDFTSFTPKAILSYQIEPRLMVYGSYAEGTRPGEFNAAIYALPAATTAALVAQTNASISVAPEKLVMYETGLKGEFLDHRLRLLSDIYYGDWTGRHVTTTLLYYAPGATTSTFVNAITGNSHVHLYGVEGKAEFAVTHDLQVTGTFAYNESKIVQTFCGTCLALTGNANPVGNRLPQYPAYTGSLAVAYQHPLTEQIDGYIHADYIYTGKQFDTESNLAWTAPANKLNLHLGVKRGKYTAEVYALNVTNDLAPTSIARNLNYATGASGILASPAEKPFVGVRVSFVN